MFKFIMGSGMATMVFFCLAILFGGFDERDEEICFIGALISGGVAAFVGTCRVLRIICGIENIE